jgi:hypothetical protein
MSLLPPNRTTVLRRLTVLATLCLSLGVGRLYASTPTLSLTEYSGDGTNTGTARLSHNATIAATVTGSASTTINWTLSGAGTITSAGVYTAPATMPSSTTVTVYAALASNTTVRTHYSMKLLYAVPVTHWTTPLSLVSGKTNSVQVGGLYFTPATTIAVNGVNIAAVFQASGAVVVQVPIAAGNTNSVSIVASNPIPGGGTSAAISVPVTPLAIAVSAYSTFALNPTTIGLGQDIQFTATVSGGDPAASFPVTWSLSGGGSISSAGLYKTPLAMPSAWSADVTATLASNTSVKATYHLSFLDPHAVVNRSAPVQIATGTHGSVTFYGENFVAGTVISVNGHTATTQYLSPSSVTALVYASSSVTGPLYITATNPAPHASTSSPFLLPIVDGTTVQATIGSTPGQAIPGDFVGFSHEWGESETYMGTTATGVDNIYRQLVKNLSNPGTPFFIRIGGGTTDTTGEPNASTTEAFAELATAMPVKFSLGVNLGANNVQLAVDQASWFSTHMPAGSIAAIELGNEPDIYASYGFRPSTYDFTDYLSDFAKWYAGIGPVLPKGVKMMAPSLTTVWHLTQNLPALEAAEKANVSFVSAHNYGGYIQNDLAQDFLLSDGAVTRQISSYLALAQQAHADGQLFRIGETNSIDGGGVEGISNTFQSALYAADSMFAEAAVGVDGVNWHGTTGCIYCPFTLGTQVENGINTFRLQQVNPIYYGLLFFHDATQNSAKMLPATVTSSTGANIKVWATQDASGTVRVAILNKDEVFTGNVSVTLPGFGTATAVRMAAPNYKSTAGITFGGQTFDNSFDGNLIGTPMNESVTPANSVYTVAMQPTSAVLLTLTK